MILKKCRTVAFVVQERIAPAGAGEATMREGCRTVAFGGKDVRRDGPGRELQLQTLLGEKRGQLDHPGHGPVSLGMEEAA